jgi:hypothetical protein
MTGIFAFMGVVYCEYPMLIYISGGIAVSCWCASTMTSMILVINFFNSLFLNFRELTDASSCGRVIKLTLFSAVGECAFGICFQ